MRLLELVKKETESKGLELEQCVAKIAALQVTQDALEVEMQPILERIIKIRTIELEVSKLYNQQTEIKTK